MVGARGKAPAFVKGSAYHTRNPVSQVVERDAEFEALLEKAVFDDQARRDEEWAEKKRQEGSDPGAREKMRASEVGYAIGDSGCGRRIWYDFHNAPREPTTMEQRINMAVSGIAANWIANVLARSDRVRKVEFTMDFDPFPVSGRLDVLCDPATKRVLEIKAVTTEQFGYLPKQEHFDQATLYTWALRHAAVTERAEPEYRAYTPSLLYIARNARKGQPTHEAYAIPYSEPRALWLLNELTKVRTIAVGEKMPDRPKGFARSDYPCAYCPFKFHCWSGQEKLAFGTPA